MIPDGDGRQGGAGERMLRMNQIHVVRHKVLAEGLGVRRVAREMGVSRNTVRSPAAIRADQRRSDSRDDAPSTTGEVSRRT